MNPRTLWWIPLTLLATSTLLSFFFVRWGLGPTVFDRIPIYDVQNQSHTPGNDAKSFFYENRHIDGWSRGKTATVVMSQKASAETFTLRLFSSNPSMEGRFVTIKAGNRLIEQLLPQGRIQSIPLEGIGPQRIDISVKEGYNPAELGINTDNRLLGFWLEIVKGTQTSIRQ